MQDRGVFANKRLIRVVTQHLRFRAAMMITGK